MDITFYPGFELFGRVIPFYGILMVTGFLLGGFAAIWRGKKYNQSKLNVVYAACFAAGGGFLGAKLLAFITLIPGMIEGKLTFLDVLSGGFVFYGGLIGGVGGLLLYVKIYKHKVVEYFDIFAPSVPLGHAVGRVGCFLAGCCYGIEVPAESGFYISYPEWYAPYKTPVGVHLLPIQLIECACLLFIYVVTETLYYKTKPRGVALFTYLFSYCILRFVLEFFRGDIIRGSLGGLSTSQWISIAIFVIAALFISLKFILPKVKKEA